MPDQNNRTNFISVVIPCYNEEAILKNNIGIIKDYLGERLSLYKWEILIINDGSRDNSGAIADELATGDPRIKVIHHPINLNLGIALQTGFRNAAGDIIVVLDVDLSYAVEHVERLVDYMVSESADIVVASPYMKGGKVTAVPFFRKIMSRWANKLMSIAAQEKYDTFTCMVRAYRTEFIRSLNLKTRDYEINPEILYKAMILRARIVEIPAHLDWTEQNKFKGKRTSSIRVIRGFFSGLMSAFIFRPYMLFVSIGLILMLLSMYQLVWLFFDTIRDMSIIDMHNTLSENRFSASLALQFRKNPQSFLVGGITLLAALQFLGLGFISLQNKRYFEELFHMGTSMIRRSNSESSKGHR